jgi:hypothetical protein
MVTSPQQHLNGEFHDWYRIVWGYSDHLVSKLIADFSLVPGDVLLDPFCGTGTTLVEARKARIASIGADANPVGVLASRVKTNWSLRSDRLTDNVDRVMRRAHGSPTRIHQYSQDLTYRYLAGSGHLDRGWISARPLRKALALKRAIHHEASDANYRDALLLVLLTTVVRNASNVRFGPELYCGVAKHDADVFDAFANRAAQMAMDLTLAPKGTPKPRVVVADSRKLDDPAYRIAKGSVRAIICSPPYPTEHDYTRNARLELAFLEAVTDRESLRGHKRRMLRSHTKGIYAGDDDGTHVTGVRSIKTLMREIDKRVAGRPHGFARLYSTVISEYFGGMQRHFRAVYPLLARGGRCAYVVGDQASYANVPVATASILAELAERAGLRVVSIEPWRDRLASVTARRMQEFILHLRKP